MNDGVFLLLFFGGMYLLKRAFAMAAYGIDVSGLNKLQKGAAGMVAWLSIMGVVCGVVTAIMDMG